MSEEKSIEIKKVRIFVPSVTNPIHLKENRDKTLKNRLPHKESTHVANDSNYAMAIYEGLDEKGNVKRDFELVSNLEAAKYYKLSVQELLKEQKIGKEIGLFPNVKTSGKIDLQLKGIVKIGTMVIFYEINPDEIWELDLNDIKKRYYKVIGLGINRVKSGNKYYEFGMAVFRFHQEARPAGELTAIDGIFKSEDEYIAQRRISHNQFTALIEGVDFIVTNTGNLKKL
jgi:CRISPR-associated endonuclease Csn1